MSFRHQVLFWLIILLALTVLFGQGPGGLSTSFYFVCMLLPVAVATSWFFNEILVPRYLITRHFIKFALYFIYSMIVSLWAQMIVITIAYIVLAELHMSRLNPEIMNIRLLALCVYGIVFLQAFLNMYQKYLKASIRAADLVKEQENLTKGFLTVRADRKQQRIEYDDILYIESLSDYVRFVLLENNEITTRKTISQLEKQLPETFVRIHRSFIIQKKMISSYTKEEVLVGKHTLPVGRKYKDHFIRSVNPDNPT